MSFMHCPRTLIFPGESEHIDGTAHGEKRLDQRQIARTVDPAASC